MAAAGRLGLDEPPPGSGGRGAAPTVSVLLGAAGSQSSWGPALAGTPAQRSPAFRLWGARPPAPWPAGPAASPAPRTRGPTPNSHLAASSPVSPRGVLAEASFAAPLSARCREGAGRPRTPGLPAVASPPPRRGTRREPWPLLSAPSLQGGGRAASGVGTCGPRGGSRRFPPLPARGRAALWEPREARPRAEERRAQARGGRGPS